MAETALIVAASILTGAVIGAQRAPLQAVREQCPGRWPPERGDFSTLTSSVVAGESSDEAPLWTKLSINYCFFAWYVA